MEDIKECRCDTTAALIAKDKDLLYTAIMEHVNHICPNYSLALYHLIEMKRKDLMPG